MHAHKCVRVRVRVCVHGGAGQAPLACCTLVFALCLPCAFQGTCGIWQPWHRRFAWAGGVLLNTCLHLQLRF